MREFFLKLNACPPLVGGGTGLERVLSGVVNGRMKGNLINLKLI